VKFPAKRISWLFLGCSLWIHAEPVEVVVTGVETREGAQRIEKRLSEEMGASFQEFSPSIMKVDGMWLVRLGPVEKSTLLREKVIERLGERGYHPMVLSATAKPGKKPSGSGRVFRGSSRLWQWILWGILGGSLLLFMIRRGLRTRKLHHSQDRLEERQRRLEKAIDQEGGVHE